MEKLSHMVDMALTPEEQEKRSTGMPMSVMGDAPKYPYGLSICLTQDELEKLDVDFGDWEVGDVFHLHALTEITSISQNETTDGKNCRVELQITRLSGEPEDAENEESEKGMGRSPY